MWKQLLRKWALTVAAKLLAKYAEPAPVNPNPVREPARRKRGKTVA